MSNPKLGLVMTFSGSSGDLPKNAMSPLVKGLGTVSKNDPYISIYVKGKIWL